MNSQLPNVPSRPPPSSKKSTMRPLNNFTKLIIESQLMCSRKRSNSSSAPTFSRTTIFPPAMSVNFPTPTCLHSSCRYQTSVDSRCHLPLATNTITPGHFVMERQSTPLNKYSWKARSDLQTGLTTKIHSGVTCQPLGHSSSAEKFPMLTKPSHPGQNGTSSTPWRKRAKASRKSPSGRCIVDPKSTSPSKLEATKKLNLVWVTKA